MRLSPRITSAGLSVASLLFLGTLPLAAQQAPPSSPSAKTEAPAAKATNTSPRRVPNYFGQLGLSPEQKDSIYKVVAKHQSRIEELKKELAEANDKMVQECESLLDDAQKKSLEARRTAAADAAKAKASAKSAKSKEDKTN
jgi:Spy/CpxP family protein refolding chaperone